MVLKYLNLKNRSSQFLTKLLSVGPYHISNSSFQTSAVHGFWIENQRIQSQLSSALNLNVINDSFSSHQEFRHGLHLYQSEGRLLLRLDPIIAATDIDQSESSIQSRDLLSANQMLPPTATVVNGIIENYFGSETKHRIVRKWSNNFLCIFSWIVGSWESRNTKLVEIKSSIVCHRILRF